MDNVATEPSEAPAGRPNGRASAIIWVSAAFLAIAALVSRWMVAREILVDRTLTDFVVTVARSTGVDAAIVGLAFALSAIVLRSSRGLTVRNARMLTAMTVVVTIGLIVAWFATVGLFMSWSMPINLQLLSLTPAMAGYAMGSGVGNAKPALLALTAVTAAYALLLAPAAAFVDRRLPARHPAGTAIACGLLALLGATSPRTAQDALLRRFSPVHIFIPVSAADAEFRVAVQDRDNELVKRLLGGQDADPATRLAPIAGRKLNVVLWILESVGARYMKSLHPLGVAKTPHLDQAMREGAVTFTNAYAESPLTVQTTWALLTGQSPPALPYVFVDAPLPSHSTTLSSTFRDAGYERVFISAGPTNMWGTRRIFDAAPWDLLEDEDSLWQTGTYARNGLGIEDRALTERFVRWIDGRAPGRPFLAALWNMGTHQPFEWWGMSPEDAAKSEPARYPETIERADREFGRLRQALVERGLIEETLIIVVGDHGEGHGRFPSWDTGHGGQVFEDDVHVPFVMLHPKLSGSVSTLVTHTDIAATLMDLAAGHPDPRVDGRSLFRPVESRPLFMRSMNWWPIAIRVGDYKLIAADGKSPVALYDLRNDPREARDLGPSMIPLRQALAWELKEFVSKRARTDSSFWQPVVPFERLWGGPMRDIPWVPPPGAGRAGSPSPSPKRPN